MCRYLRVQLMDASSSQIQVRVLPEEVDSPEAVRTAVERQLRKEGRPSLPHDAVVRVLRQSWDARKRPVRAQLLVGWGHGAEKADIGDWTWKQVPKGAPEVIVVGAGPAGLYAALECLRHGLRPCLLYTSPSPRDLSTSRMPSSA